MTAQVKKFILLLGDLALLYLALFLALSIRYQHWPDNNLWNNHWPLFSVIFLLWLIVFYLNNLYDLRRTKNNFAFFRSFLTAVGLNFLFAVGFFYIINEPSISPKTLLVILTLVYLPIFVVWRLFLHLILDTKAFKNRLLFLGLNAEATELIKVFNQDSQLGHEVVAIITNQNNPLLSSLPTSLTVLYSPDDLLKIVKEKNVDMVVLVNVADDANTKRLLYEIILSRIEVINNETFFENITHRVPLSALSEGWFLENLKETQKNFYDILKRAIDIFLALLAGIIFLPPLPFLALIIFLFDRGPIFYCQTRVGRDGKIFTITKLRTMIVNAEQNGTQFTQPGDPRITKVGKFLRLSRLDEIPQAWNILKNEMSFIGPRPERPEFVSELEKMMPYYNARHLVKPGLTGWSQVNYGYADNLQRNLTKLQYDLFYIKNRSLLLDGAILLKTVNVVIKWLGR